MGNTGFSQAVFDAIYMLIEDGEYALLDGSFASTDVSKLSVDTMLTLLCHSRSAEKYFQHRDAFYKRCFDELSNRGRNANNLIGGLEHHNWSFAFNLLPDPPEPKEVK